MDNVDELAEALGVKLFYGLVEMYILGIYCIGAWKVGWTKAPANVSPYISGRVTEDLNNADVGGIALVGVLITLFDGSKWGVATTLTDGKGEYVFVDLPAGVYTMTETNLSGFSGVFGVDGVNERKARYDTI